MVVSLSADGARVQLPRRLDKPAGAPLRLEVNVERIEHHLALRTLRATLPGGPIEASGTYALDTEATHLVASVREFHLSRLSTVIPSAAERIPSGAATASGTFSFVYDGRPSEPGAAELRLDTDLRGAFGHLRGTGDIVGLDHPRRVRLDLSCDDLNLDALARDPIVGADSTTPRAPAQPMMLRTFHAELRLDHGSMQPLSPMTMLLDDGDMSLSGSVSAAHAIARTGTFHISPDAIDRATHGQRIPSGPVPVSIRVTGTADAPRVEIVDLGATMRALLGSRLRGIGRAIGRALTP